MRADPGQFLVQDQVIGVVGVAPAAVLLVDIDAEQAGSAGREPDVTRDGTVALPLLVVRRDLPGDEGPDHIAERIVLAGEDFAPHAVPLNLPASARERNTCHPALARRQLAILAALPAATLPPLPPQPRRPVRRNPGARSAATLAAGPPQPWRPRSACVPSGSPLASGLLRSDSFAISISQHVLHRSGSSRPGVGRAGNRCTGNRRTGIGRDPAADRRSADAASARASGPDRDPPAPRA